MKNIKEGKKKRYLAIIFDLDGTLIDSLPYHVKAFREILRENEIKISNKKLKLLIGVPSEIIFKKFKKKYHLMKKVEDLRQERRKYYFKLAGKRNIVFPCVKKILKKLRKKHKLAIATGSSKVVFHYSFKKDFQELFNVVVTISDVKNGKPNPEQLLLAAKKMKIRPEKCLMIGDSIYDGIAASRAKMDFIAVTTGFTSKKVLKKYGAKKVISSLPKLRNLV